MVEENIPCTLTQGTMLKDHNAYLNSLNREHKGLYLPLASFEGTEAAWDGIPVIFADDHPDMDVFAENPELALGKVNGRIVGITKGTHIENVGTPKLATTLELEDDPGLERQITPPPGVDARMSISTGFFHDGLKADPDLPVPKVTGKVRPQHVLLFIESIVTNDVPGDGGAMIINKLQKEDNNLTESEEALGLIDKLRAIFTKVDPEPEPEPATMQEAEAEPVEEAAPVEANTPEEALDAASEAVTEAIGAESFDPEAGKKLAAALVTIEQLRSKIAEMEAGSAEEEAEMKWESFKKHATPGMLHEEKEAELRKMYEADPDAAWRTVLTSKTDPDLPGEEGETFTAGGEGEAEFKSKDRWDPATQTYVEAERY